MVNYEQLLNMDTSKITTASETSGNLSGKLAGRGSELSAASNIPASMWEGADAQAAGSKIAEPVPFLHDSSDMFRESQGVLETLAGDLNKAKEHLRGAQDLVAGTGITIGADGTVTTPVVDTPEEDDQNQEKARQAGEIIRQALAMAKLADSTAQAALVKGGQSVLDFLNGGWTDAMNNLDNLARRMLGMEEVPNDKPTPFENMTQTPGKESYLSGLFGTEVKHGGDDGIKVTGGMNSDSAGIGIGGDPTRSIEFKGPQVSAGGVTAGTPSVKLHNSLIPGIQMAEVDGEGRTQIKPKLQLPLVSVTSPVAVDPEKVGEQLSKVPAPKPLPVPRIPSW